MMMMMLGKFHHDLNQRPKPIDDGECKVNFSPTYGLISGLWIMIISRDDDDDDDDNDDDDDDG